MIIVIVILSVLMIVWYLSISSWISKSKDTSRIADLNSISTALDASLLSANKFPDPDSFTWITNESWIVMWYQWIFGKSAISNTAKLSKDPVDPENKTFYFHLS